MLAARKFWISTKDFNQSAQQMKWGTAPAAPGDSTSFIAGFQSYDTSALASESQEFSFKQASWKWSFRLLMGNILQSIFQP